ncbi:MAG: DNA repair protein RadC [Bacteroidetes bacterium]|jgi:DNA repair protein RadC|nr:DNA repair protein RadC [Bacteroidota bacterium]
MTDMPRERLLHHGPAALSTMELMALLIGHGTTGRSAADIARSVLERFPSLTDLAARDVSELRSINGMGAAKAATICAALELAHRIQAEPFKARPVITSPAILARLMAPRLRHQRTESFHVLLMNTANQVVRDVTVSEGSLNSVLIHPREVFRLAIAENAAAVILVHNHPSGNTEPSKEDMAITRQLVDAGRIVDIRVLDHVIIGGDEFTSLAERNLI